MRIVCNGGHRERTEESTGGEHEIRLDHVNQMDTYIYARGTIATAQKKSIIARNGAAVRIFKARFLSQHVSYNRRTRSKSSLGLECSTFNLIHTTLDHH